MNAGLYHLTEQGLLLVLYCAGPPVLAGALAGALTEFIQRRAGVENSALPGVVRLLVGLLAVLALGPGVAGQVARFSSTVWTALPTLGQ